MKAKVPKAGPSQETYNLTGKIGGKNRFLERQGKCCFLRKQCRLGDRGGPGSFRGCWEWSWGEGQTEGFTRPQGKGHPRSRGLLGKGKAMGRCLSGNGSDPGRAVRSGAHGRALNATLGAADFSLWWAVAGCSRNTID